MIQLLSFDIGIKNMAYCYAIIDNEKLDIKSLNKVDLNCKKNDIQNIIDNTIEFLDTIMNELNINYDEKTIVLIECQMTSIMKCIQTTINTYFKMTSKYLNADVETHYVSPKHKLKIINKHSEKIVNDKYKQNKIDAVFFATHLLETTYKNEEILNYVKSLKKKDDVCDALLMCIYYFEK
jgi:hypothetical protein